MSSGMEVDPQTRINQERASNPAHSAWVSANAGSGKTTVLSRRVVRLLLSGTNPSRILCLTFTKAAAGEMSNRVFSILGEWAVLPDAELIEKLSDIQGKRPTSQQVDTARTLFAKALETPGGLKIQTIHAFCEALLHQFPLEANIPGSFTVLDDARQTQLLDQARREIVLAAHSDPQSEIGQAFFKVMDFASDTAIDKVLNEVIEKRHDLAEWLNEIGGPLKGETQSKQLLGYNVTDDPDQLRKDALANGIFSDSDLQRFVSLTHEDEKPKSTNLKLADRINAYFATEQTAQRFEKYFAIFTTEGKPRAASHFATKDIKAQFDQFEERLTAETERLLTASQRIKTLVQIIETTSLLTVAQAMIAHYNTLKRRSGLLDFDDLISKSADLLTRKSARSWVLYKLDLGLDHILLDEAQDTSPQQWRIIDSLVEEFFAGQSARLVNRTVFAVGDEKQSIYSFQGAEPKQFALQKKKYQKLVEAGEKDFKSVNLNLSFRSTPDVLGAVDAVFENAEHADGVTFEDKPPPHVAARRSDPGQVDIWPLEEPLALEEPPDWQTPQDAMEISHQAVRLADRIASQIATWIGKERLEATGQLIAPGDIVVLVRARDRFMTALNRKLKDLGVPVAGADRLLLTGHIAVQDLMALGQVMLTPQDDLSLAAVLKSPLIGLDEEQIFALARSRLRAGGEASLFETLVSSQSDSEFEKAGDLLSRWRKLVGQLPVFEFFAQVLGANGRLRRFYSRLGHEAEDVLEAFLDATLSHEQTGLPGMQSFLESLSNDTPEIKRDMDQTAGAVRVMTVHAAKGLEASVVFLVDKCSPAFSTAHAPALYQWQKQDQKTFLWNPSSKHHGDATLSLMRGVKKSAEQEYRRLLYVGMTRAKDRLIVCGYYNGRTLPSPNWHGMVSSSLEANWQDICNDDGALIYHRWKSPDSPVPQPLHHDDETQLDIPKPISLPGWINHHLPQERALPKPLNPSGAQALIDEELVRETVVPSLLNTQQGLSGTSAARRGTALHKLLQVLPDTDQNTRFETATEYLRTTLPHESDQTRAQLVQELLKVLDSDRLKPCFDPKNSRAEVSIMGHIDLKNGSKPVSGTIDRLAVFEHEAVILDYKTSAFIPKSIQEIPADYCTQMGLYRKLIQRLYPEKSVRAILVWTHAPNGPVIFELPFDVLDETYLKIAQL